MLRYNNDFFNYNQIDQFPLFLGKYISSAFTRRQDLLYLKYKETELTDCAFSFLCIKLFNNDKLCHSMKHNFIKL